VLNRRNNVRLLAAVGLTLLVVAAAMPVSSQPAVNVAFDIYKGCMEGNFMAARIVPTRPAINEYLKQVDENCLLWTLIWYKPIVEDGPNIPDWPIASVRIFDARRTVFLIRYEALVKAVILDKD